MSHSARNGDEPIRSIGHGQLDIYIQPVGKAELTMNGSMGQWVMGQWVEWVTKIGWVRWVMGHCSVTHDSLQKNNFYVNI
jgi:hypothetical protein